MKAKLVKRSNGRFDLYEIKDVDQLNTIASSFDNPKGKLSLKNCQAIELGYDLVKLSKDFANDHKKETDMAYEFGRDMYSFREGFKKALELLSDKKFSSKEMIFAYTQGTSDGSNVQSMVENEDEDAIDYAETCTNEFIQSLQQDKWDVEIYTLNDCQGDFEKCNNENFTCVFCTDTGIPKLDEDNCLILKRI